MPELADVTTLCLLAEKKNEASLFIYTFPNLGQLRSSDVSSIQELNSTLRLDRDQVAHWVL